MQYCALVNGLVQKSQAALSTLLEPSENTAEYLRLRTNKREIIIAPGKDYTVVVVQETVKKVEAAGASNEAKQD